MPLSVPLPNVRKLFLADPGYTMYEADLKGADAQIVAWEAEDEDLKSAFRAGTDIHTYNAEAMWGSSFTKLPEGSHDRKRRRQECKRAIHGINYGAASRTVAIHNGWTTHEADQFRQRWLSIHPGISRWHDRIRLGLERSRSVTNPFGFSRIFFDRIGSCFTEALAWIPQSAVAINTFSGAFQLEARYWPWDCDASYVSRLDGLLLQTHDSINFQFPAGAQPPAQEIMETLLVKTPYEDPLYIPWDLKCGRSWGEMRKVGD